MKARGIADPQGAHIEEVSFCEAVILEVEARYDSPVNSVLVPSVSSRRAARKSLYKLHVRGAKFNETLFLSSSP